MIATVVLTVVVAQDVGAQYLIAPELQSVLDDAHTDDLTFVVEAINAEGIIDVYPFCTEGDLTDEAIVVAGYNDGVVQVFYMVDAYTAKEQITPDLILGYGERVDDLIQFTCKTWMSDQFMTMYDARGDAFIITLHHGGENPWDFHIVSVKSFGR